MINKVYSDAASSLKDILQDGMTIMSGGFGISGIPESLISAIQESGVKNLTVISNNCGIDDWGLGALLKNRQIKKFIASYVGGNKEFEREILAGEVEVEINPQGTLAERIRAGGAGIAAFYTKTGVGTLAATGKEVREFDGVKYLMEEALKADISIVKAWKADKEGNLVYRKTARNFNPDMATAGNITIAEVDEIVDIGKIDPDHIHTPGIFVNRIIKTTAAKKIENLMVMEGK